MDATTTHDYTTPTGRLAAVTTSFEPKWGPLYVDEMHTEPLWDMTYPSAECMAETDDAANAECADRVAAAIALMAYGREAVA